VSVSAGRAIVATALIGSCLLGQSKDEKAAPAAPEFEVASVKPSNSDLFDIVSHVPNLDVGPGRMLKIGNITLKDILMLAYKVGAAQISGPRWLLNRFNVVAKVPADAVKDQIPLMLQALLKDRFKLALHLERKEMQVYVLVIGGHGSKLQSDTGDEGANSGCTRTSADSERATVTGATVAANCHAVSAASLTQALQTLAPNYFDRPVVNATGLTGVYDFTLEWISYSESVTGGTGPTIFDAVQQLGLRLERRKQVMDLLVIDHCEKEPTAN
jgi:uncharacterized protein (TIGR03435 family)